MIITRKHLSRRTVLRGVGAAVALPLLDSMVPALTALGRTAAAPVRRLGVFYVPNGMAMGYWTPQTEGALAGPLPPTLASLAPFRDQLLLVSGLADESAGLANRGGDHARASGTFLTGVPYEAISDSNVHAGVSMDQVAARHFGAETQLASLELALDSVLVLGACDGASCALTNTLAWRTPTTPLPCENDPRAVFERLFGTSGSTDAGARLDRIRRDRSMLDFVNGQIASLERVLGAPDRARLGEYLESVRDVERRLQKAEEQNSRELPVVDQPMGIPSTYAEHATLMMDLLALAYQTDLTRVSTFMLAREVSGRAYPEIGVPDSHHPLSHHMNEPAKIERLHKINTFHVQQFAHLVEKLHNTPEGDGTLLDRSLLVYGAGISDSNTHFHDDLPIALVGGLAAARKGGRHIRYPQGTPIANLWVTALNLLDVPRDRFGDSNGRLPQLIDPLTGIA